MLWRVEPAQIVVDLGVLYYVARFLWLTRPKGKAEESAASWGTHPQRRLLDVRGYTIWASAAWAEGHWWVSVTGFPPWYRGEWWKATTDGWYGLWAGHTAGSAEAALAAAEAALQPAASGEEGMKREAA